MTRAQPEADREREILYRAIHIASSARRTPEVLDAVVALVSEAVACEACFVYLWNPDREHLVLSAASAPYADAVGSVTFGLGVGVVGWAAQHRESVLLAQRASEDPRYEAVPGLGGSFDAMISVPIVSRSDALVGAINVHAASGAFGEADVRFLEHAASLVAGGIENAQLFSLAAERELALASLARKTIVAQEDERRRVAIEIHDGVTQQLVSIWFRVQACQRLLERSNVARALAELEATKALIDETLAEARVAIYNLRPATLDDLGLVAAIQALAGRVAGETGTSIEVDAPDELRLTPHLETALYRIAQEALTNIRKHAKASRAEVELLALPAAVELRVTDDGDGFDLRAFADAPPQTSFGLSGMRERLELVGGTLTVESHPGRGTRITACVPLLSEGAA